jgi:hypothetical protein
MSYGVAGTPFFEWLNPRTPTSGNMKERGLRDDAPEEAKKAFQEYLDMREDMRRRGFK